MLPTPATHGNAAMSPAQAAHATTSVSRNGKRRLWGCHGSNSSSLPIVQARPAAGTMASTAAWAPPTRPANTAIPMMQRTLTVPAPMARPMSPSILAGRAYRSKSNGPGWLRSTPKDCVADDQSPRSGWCDVNTSRARMAK